MQIQYITLVIEGHRKKNFDNVYMKRCFKNNENVYHETCSCINAHAFNTNKDELKQILLIGHRDQQYYIMYILVNIWNQRNKMIPVRYVHV